MKWNHKILYKEELNHVEDFFQVVFVHMVFNVNIFILKLLINKNNENL